MRPEVHGQPVHDGSGQHPQLTRRSAVKTTDDLRICPLCVLDKELRAFSRNEPAIHSLLADLVVAHLVTRSFIKRHSDQGAEGVSESVASWRALRGRMAMIEASPTDRSVAAQHRTRRGSGEFRLQAKLAQNLGIGVMFTFVSITPSYAQRRVLERLRQSCAGAANGS